MNLRGVDGCKGGWLCATLNPSTGEVEGEVFADTRALLAVNAASITAIDIPIGLPETQSRRCDVEARTILGPRASSVFPTPVRACVDSESYRAACDASLDACGKRMSKQAFAILPRIRAVDAVLRESHDLQDRVYEVHPEVCFYFWNGGRPMEYPKRSGLGFTERYHLVSVTFPGAFESIRTRIPAARAADDDILDALAALWTAVRIRSGIAELLPATPEFDAYGLPMRMLA